MAYMTNQWLKTEKNNNRFHYPVSIDFKNADSMYESADARGREVWEEKNNISFTLELEKKEDAGYGYGKALIEKTHQRIYFTKTDVEFLIWLLIRETSGDISDEYKLKLIALLASEDTE